MMNHELLFYAPDRVDGNNESVKPLTPRELEVLTLVGKGFFYKEIANKLVISRLTVKSHMISDSGIFQKLDVRSGTGAVIVAVKEGIINLDELTKGYDLDTVLTCSHLERNILAAMVEKPKEESNMQLAKKVLLGKSTIRNHMTSIMKKLGVPNRTAAVAVYMAWQKKEAEASGV